MAPKKAPAVKQHYVYIVQDEEWSDPDEVDSDFDYTPQYSGLVEVHADLQLAKSSARQHFMTQNAGFENEDLQEDDVGDAETVYSIRWVGQLDDAAACIKTRVITMPLVGGNISFSRAKKGTAKAISPVSVQSDGDDELNDDMIVPPVQPVTPATVAKAAAKAGNKRKSLDEVDDEEDDETPSPQLANVEHHVRTLCHISRPDDADHNSQFAPSGEGECLKGMSILITGTLDPWTRDQAKALIEFFGGTMESNLKTGIDYVVIATKPGVKKLSDLNDPKYSSIEKISQKELYDLIESSEGNGQIHSKEAVTAICKAAKKAPKKKAKKA